MVELPDGKLTVFPPSLTFGTDRVVFPNREWVLQLRAAAIELYRDELKREVR